jgi:cell division septal protein FtsQ
MLHLQVSSPRIVFFDCVKFLARFLKLGVVLLVMVGVGFALGFGWQKLFVENEEFVIDYLPIQLKGGGEARFLTASRVQKMTGLDLKKTIFAVDAEELQERIEALPEIKAATVRRRLPGTLKIEVVEREPVAWVACRSLAIEERNRESGFLLDREGVPFRCDSEKLWSHAEQLPVVMVPRAPEGTVEEGRALEHQGLQRALALVMLAKEKLEITERPAWVIVKDEIFLEMKTRAGTLVTLSYYDQERQIENFIKLTSHARRKGKELAQVNLIPRRFIPVHYQ